MKYLYEIFVCLFTIKILSPNSFREKPHPCSYLNKALKGFISTRWWQEEFARSDIGLQKRKKRVLQKKQVEGINHREVEEERGDEEVASYIPGEDSANSLPSVRFRPQGLKQDSLIVSSDSQKNNCWDFPSPVAGTPCSQCRGLRFDP